MTWRVNRSKFDDFDAIIRGPLGHAEAARLICEAGVPASHEGVRDRRRRLGLCAPTRRAPRWTDEERADLLAWRGALEDWAAAHGRSVAACERELQPWAMAARERHRERQTAKREARRASLLGSGGIWPERAQAEVQALVDGAMVLARRERRTLSAVLRHVLEHAKRAGVDPGAIPEVFRE